MNTKDLILQFRKSVFAVFLVFCSIFGWGQITNTYNYTGSDQTFTVPTGVTSLTVKIWGAGGAGGYYGMGGTGAYVTGTLAVTPGDILTVVVGMGGQVPTSTTATTYYGGGGNGGYAATRKGGGGGGRSSIRYGGVDIVTAGGGGGGGGYLSTYYPSGGGGGATNGNDSVTTTGGTYSGKAATATAGGAAGGTGAGTAPTAGSVLVGGNGGVSTNCGGGGGGGYYGGGGGTGYTGSTATVSTRVGGGGGGLSYVAYSGFSGTNTSGTAGSYNTSGTNTSVPGNTDANYASGVGQGGTWTPAAGGNGLVVITYYLPYDAGITNVDTSNICSGVSKSITATLKNYGTSTLTSATINWSVNGVAQTPYSWSGSLASGSTTNVTLGTYTFSAATNYTIIASTGTTLNGSQTDGNSSNNSFTTSSFQASLSGTYTVGTAGNFTTLAAAVTAANTYGLCGPTVFSLIDASYALGTTALTINALTGSSSTNTLTIKPASGISSTISGSSSTAIFQLSGANYIIIDGSNIVGGTSKNLTITNTDTTSGAAVQFTGGASNNVLKNSVIYSRTSTWGTVTFYQASSSSGNNYNTVQNNDIGNSSTTNLPYRGILNNGSSTTYPNTDNIVIGNNIYNFSLAGIYDAGYSTGSIYDGNNIYGTLSSTTNIFGIRFQETTIYNVIARNNKIYDLSTTSTSTSGLIAGIHFYDIASGTTCNVYNNTIALKGNGAALPASLYGILEESTSGTVNIYHNSINIYSSASSTSVSYALYKYYTDTTILKNNIFSNTRTTTGTGGQYAVGWTGRGSFTSDYNVIYSSGNTYNYIGDYSGAISNLADWQAAVDQDSNSLVVIPSFVSNTDLHVSITCGSSLESAGTPIATVTTDIDGNARSTSAPDIGADEFSGATPPTFTTVSGSNCSSSGVASVDLSASSTDSSVTGFKWYAASTGGTSLGTTTNGGTFTVSVSTTTTYYVAAIYNSGICESDVRSPVLAVVTGTPTAISAINQDVTPSSATVACDVDYVKLTLTGGEISSTAYNEDFSSTSGWAYGGGNTNILAAYYTSANAGGTSPEAGLYRATGNTSSSWYFYPYSGSASSYKSIDISGYTSLSLTFKYMFDARTTSSFTRGIYVDISTDASNWVSVWSVTGITADISATTGTADLSSYVGNSSIYIRFRYTGDSGGLNYWWLDNISISGIRQPVIWSPTDGLYTDATLTTAYTGDIRNVVYAAPKGEQIYIAKASCVSNSTTVTRNKYSFTGNTNNFWNNSNNWFPNEIPDTDKCVIIPTGKVAIVDTDIAVAKRVSVESGGKLTISSGESLTVVEGITNNSLSGDFTVESDGNLVQTNDGSVNTGSITLKRGLLLSSGRKEYNYVSSPVTVQNLKNIYEGNSSGTATTTSSSNVPALYYNESTDYFGTSSGANISGRGLALKEAPISMISSSTPEFQFVGVPYNSPASYLTYSLSWTNSTRGYNLVGNPYPSNLDLNKLYDDSSNIESTFRFWDNSVNTLYSQQGSGYGGSSYAIYNALSGSSGTGIPAPGNGQSSTGGSKVPTNIVKPGQGFIVRATSSGASLVFKNTQRTTVNGGVYYSGKQSDDRYWLKLTTPKNLVITQAIVYFGNGSNSYGLDDSVLNSLPSDAFYSWSEDHKVMIQGKSPFVTSDVVGLGQNYYESGDYKISLGDKEGVFANGQSIYLRDRVLNILTDLTKGDYVYSSGSGEFTDRFEIVYEPDSVLGTGGSSIATGIQIYRDGDDFVVRSPQKDILEVELYDASGKLVYKHKSGSKEERIPCVSFIAGMYVLKARFADGSHAVKKMRK